MLSFLVPAIVGVRHGLRWPRISLTGASGLAVVVTILMSVAWTSHALWVYNWFLLAPVWCLVVAARVASPRTGRAAETGQS